MGEQICNRLTQDVRLSNCFHNSTLTVMSDGLHSKTIQYYMLNKLHAFVVNIIL